MRTHVYRRDFFGWKGCPELSLRVGSVTFSPAEEFPMIPSLWKWLHEFWLSQVLLNTRRFFLGGTPGMPVNSNHIFKKSRTSWWRPITGLGKWWKESKKAPSWPWYQISERLPTRESDPLSWNCTKLEDSTLFFHNQYCEDSYFLPGFQIPEKVVWVGVWVQLKRWIY